MNDHEPEVRAYMEGVLDGTVPAGRFVKLAVRRQVEDEQNAPSRGFVFSSDHANYAIDIASFCRHSKGEWDGQPFVLSPWQKFCDWCVFGWLRQSDRMRRFRKDYREVARKNGKSTDTARKGIQLTALDNPQEPGAEVYVAATKEDQANIIHSEATRMVRQSPSLKKLFKVYKKNLTCESLNSYFRPIGSDSDKTDGLNPHGVLKDELHAWQERHRGLNEKLSTGGASRRQPLECIITTAGDDKSVLWWEEREFARKVLESVITGEIISDTLFAFIACIDDEDKETIERLFDSSATEPPREIMMKSNPNLDVSVKWDYLCERFQEAKHKPTARNSFLRYQCNVRVSSTEKAISPETWSACKGRVEVRDGELAFGAWDLGRSDDWAAIALLFPKSETEVHIKTKTWTCKDTQHINIQQHPWRACIERGELIISSGDAVDFNDVEDAIAEWHKQYNVRSWAYDPNFAKQMAQRCEQEYGFTPFAFTQSHKHYNEPVRKFLRSLADCHVVHDGNYVLSYQADSMVITKNARDEWMPDKTVGKIDAMVAILMAYSEWLFSDRTTGKSIYSTYGMLTGLADN